MTVQSQDRPTLSTSVQQCANKKVAALVSQQLTAPFTQDFTLLPEKDRFIGDTTAGSLVITVPVAATSLAIGKPYIVEKKSGANTLTIQLSGDDLFGGSSTVVLSGDGDMFAFIVDDDGLIHLAFPAPLSDAVPAGALAIDQNLADLDDPDVALTNLGATTDGAAILKGTAIFTFGPIALDIIAANADEFRFRPGFGGTLKSMVLALTKGTTDGTVVVTPTIAAAATTPASAQHAALAAPGNTIDTPITAGGGFTADQEIRGVVSGTNTVAGKTYVTLEYTRTPEV